MSKLETRGKFQALGITAAINRLGGVQVPGQEGGLGGTQDL